MRAFRKLCIAVLTIFLMLSAVLNIVMFKHQKYTDGQYRLEAKRLADEIAETGSYDLADFPHITGVYTGDDLYKSDEHYVIIEANGTLYRVEYTLGNDRGLFIVSNCILGILFLLLCGVFVYLWRNVIKPFGSLNDVPQELARGNLAVPIPEQKSGFSGNSHGVSICCGRRSRMTG